MKKTIKIFSLILCLTLLISSASQAQSLSKVKIDKQADNNLLIKFNSKSRGLLSLVVSKNKPSLNSIDCIKILIPNPSSELGCSKMNNILVVLAAKKGQNKSLVNLTGIAKGRYQVYFQFVPNKGETDAKTIKRSIKF